MRACALCVCAYLSQARGHAQKRVVIRRLCADESTAGLMLAGAAVCLSCGFTRRATDDDCRGDQLCARGARPLLSLSLTLLYISVPVPRSLCARCFGVRLPRTRAPNSPSPRVLVTYTPIYYTSRRCVQVCCYVYTAPSGEILGALMWRGRRGPISIILSIGRTLASTPNARTFSALSTPNLNKFILLRFLADCELRI